MAEQRETFIRDPNAVGAQQSIVPLASVKDFHARDVDPGAVGTGSVWKDTSVGAGGKWWERNATDDGWDAISDVYAQAVGDAEARSRSRAYTAGAGAALSGPTAITEGAGDADARPTATSGGGMLGAGLTGSALSGPVANSDDGRASVAGQATTTGVGNAEAGNSATATDAGDAGVNNDATANTGIASISTQAIRQGVAAGMTASVEADGIARLGFNAVAAVGGIPIPELTATPDADEIAAMLVALGICTQVAP